MFSEAVLAELRANPGRWALLRTYKRPGGKRPVKHPLDIELHWDADRGASRTHLYARAVKK